MQTLSASKTPVQDIDRIAYSGQDPKRRMYRAGYENYFNEMPFLDPSDVWLKTKVELSRNIFKELALKLQTAEWVKENPLGEYGFDRTILALEKPEIGCTGTPHGEYVKHEGAEFVVARWGDGHTSPVHGHAAGYGHEEILFGKMRINTYRLMPSGGVRPVRTFIAEQGTFVSEYTKRDPNARYPRQELIHNFTSIGFSASLHFLSEHTRDGRDNTFPVEHFTDWHDITEANTEEIDSKEGMYQPKGTVLLVRSENVPEYGDHYIVITGMPVMKPHGLRPRDIAIQGSAKMSGLLDKFEKRMGVTLLKLDDDMRRNFFLFHGIEKSKDGEIIFPND